MSPNLSLKPRLRINKQTKVQCSVHTGLQMPLTASVPGPCFILGVVVPFPTTSCSGGALVLFRKSTSSSALVFGISEENTGYSERVYLSKNIKFLCAFVFTQQTLGLICFVCFSIKWQELVPFMTPQS